MAKKRKALLAFMGLILACSVIVTIIGLIDTSLGEIVLLPIDTPAPTRTRGASVTPTNIPTSTLLSTQTAILADAPRSIRPTSTPLPVDTAVATDIPTSTPVATQPPPSPRVEVQLYASEVRDQLQTLTDAMQATRTLMRDPELSSEAWKTDVEAQLDIIRLVHQELTEMNVPVEMIGIHSAILNATLYCKLASDYATGGIDNLNPDDIQIATNLMARCGANMSIALEVIIEIYKGKPILYDTGDLIDDYYVDIVHRNDQQFLFLVTATQGGVERIELVPVLISNAQVNTAGGEVIDEMYERMQKLSADMGTEVKREGDRLVVDTTE